MVADTQSWKHATGMFTDISSTAPWDGSLNITFVGPQPHSLTGVVDKTSNCTRIYWDNKVHRIPPVGPPCTCGRAAVRPSHPHVSPSRHTTPSRGPRHAAPSRRPRHAAHTPIVCQSIWCRLSVWKGTGTACAAGPFPPQPDPDHIEKVYVVYANHLDVGYTDMNNGSCAGSVVNRWGVANPGRWPTDHR